MVAAAGRSSPQLLDALRAPGRAAVGAVGAATVEASLLLRRVKSRMSGGAAALRAAQQRLAVPAGRRRRPAGTVALHFALPCVL